MARPIAKDHDHKRQMILTCAARVFAEEGYASAAMSQVAQACGISKANIYHYYKSKDDILFDILRAHLSALRALVLDVPETPNAPEAQFRQMVRTILHAYEGADYEHRLQVSAMGYLAERQQQELRGYQRDLVECMSSVIQTIAPGLSNDPAALRGATMSVFGMLNWFYMWHPNADRDARSDYATLVADVSLKGIGGIGAA